MVCHCRQALQARPARQTRHRQSCPLTLPASHEQAASSGAPAACQPRARPHGPRVEPIAAALHPKSTAEQRAGRSSADPALHSRTPAWLVFWIFWDLFWEKFPQPGFSMSEQRTLVEVHAQQMTVQAQEVDSNLVQAATSIAQLDSHARCFPYRLETDRAVRPTLLCTPRSSMQACRPRRLRGSWPMQLPAPPSRFPLLAAASPQMWLPGGSVKMLSSWLTCVSKPPVRLWVMACSCYVENQQDNVLVPSACRTACSGWGREQDGFSASGARSGREVAALSCAAVAASSRVMRDSEAPQSQQHQVTLAVHMAGCVLRWA